MFAGTSTGGLIAIGLAAGMTPSQLLDVYMAQGAFIFKRTFVREVRSADDISGPKYDNANREQLCRDVFQDKRLKDLRSADNARGHIVITSFDLGDRSEPDPATRRWKAKIFHNLPTCDDSGDDLEYAYRVAMRTSAAPTYFASYDGFVDGGVFANNPSMCALAQTQDRRLASTIAFDSIRMLSLGTGFFPYHVDGDASWGLVQWAPKIVGLLMDGVNEVADFQAAQMLAKNAYYRVPLRLQTDIAMDDASNLGVLQQTGNQVDISAATNFIANW